MTSKIKILFSFSLGILMLVAAGIYSYRATQKYQNANDWVSHTLQVIAEGQSALYSVQRFESAQRGYVITGDTSYLKPYYESIHNVATTMALLKHLTRDNPGQQVLLDSIQGLINGKIAWAQKVIAEEQKNGLKAARNLVLTGVGKNFMTNIRDALLTFIGNEETLLTLRLQVAQQNFERTVRVIVFSIVLAIALIVVTMVLYVRDFNERLRMGKKVAENEEKFNKAFHNSPVGIAITSIATEKFVDCNESFLNGIGWERHEVIGRTASDINLLPEMVRQEIWAQMRKNGHIQNEEFQFQKKSGESGTMLFSSEVLRMNGEDFSMTVLNNISQRKQMEQELKRINAELNGFAYVASHDLKSPMRGISQLAEWISEDLSDKAGPETQNHLRLMRSRIKRLEKLLDDLLAYSRAGRLNGELVNVDANDMLQQNFDLISTGKPVHLQMQAGMPPFRTLRAPLELIFRNLMGNAIKHGGDQELLIEVSEVETATGFEFTVRDDGPGIAPEHHERVFGMFQTLKPRDEVEGSGMGLALIKKTVETLGETITLESDGSHGCSFKFTWPNEEKLRRILNAV